jgi:Lysozyme like domain
VPVLNDDQLAAVLRKAHVSPGDAAYLVAIAHPESGADPEAVQQGEPYATTGWGLWQITPGNSEPQFGINHALLAPQANADAAAAKLRSQGLGAWTTYTSGKYEPYFGAAKTAVASVYGMSMQQVDQLAASAGHGGPIPAQTTGGIGGCIEQGLYPFGLPVSFLGGVGQTVGDVGTAVAELAKAVSRLELWLSWLFVPSHWIRIISFALGVPLTGAGVMVMVKGTQPIPVSVGPVGTEISGGSAAPAVGIAMVTGGAVLLFIAFHNLPDNVSTFPQLLSHLQAGIQGKGGSQPATRPRPQAA